MLYRLIESMTIAMVENSQKLVIKMDVQNAKSDVSKDGDSLCTDSLSNDGR